MQLSIVSGVLANEAAEFEIAYPVNLEPLIVKSGVSQGQLRTAPGAVAIGEGPGSDRGGREWNGVLYRVMGTKLVTVAQGGAVTVLGDVGGDGPVSLDNSFDRLIIRSGAALWYWNGTALTRVDDPDLGPVVDAIWVDGYTMTTDGRYVPVTELNDPMQVKPLKYGSAEADPDAITGLVKARGEVYVIGRHTIQVLQNVGGAGFPFAVVPGATIETGCVSASAKTRFGNSFAFVGSSREEALGVHVAGQGAANKISTRAVDDALAAEADPTAIVLEERAYRDETRLYVHLARESWVFLAKASEAAGEAVWHRARSGSGAAYRPRNAVLSGGEWIVGDAGGPALGRLDHGTSAHFGEPVEWRFDAGLIYNGGKGAILDAVELIGLPGRGADRGAASAFLSYSRDGQTWSQERAVSLGRAGERGKRIQWRPHVKVGRYMALRFRGVGSAVDGFAACEVQARPLSV